MRDDDRGHPLLYSFLLIGLLSASTVSLLSSAAPGTAIKFRPHEPNPKSLQNLVESEYRKGFQGAVLVADHHDVILRTAIGNADDASKTVATPETVFDVGSITKQFTAAAVLLLESQGRLSVQDKLAKYFQNAPTDKQQVTIHELLTHTSCVCSDHMKSDFEPLTRQMAVDRILKAKLQCQPGSKYEYSNSGYTLLAAIIEQVSGDSYFDFMRNKIFEPVGMKRTGFYNEKKWTNLRVAHGYMNGKDYGLVSQFAGPYWTVAGNGGVLSTIDDMHLWVETLQANKFLPAEETSKLFTRYIRQPGPKDEAFYGYGWTLGDTTLGPVITHNGGGVGGNSDLMMFPDRSLLLIALGNRIEYKTKLGLPVNVHLYASNLNRHLRDEIAAPD